MLFSHGAVVFRVPYLLCCNVSCEFLLATFCMLTALLFSCLSVIEIWGELDLLGFMVVYSWRLLKNHFKNETVSFKNASILSICIHIQLFSIDVALSEHIAYMNYIRKSESVEIVRSYTSKVWLWYVAFFTVHDVLDFIENFSRFTGKEKYHFKILAFVRRWND